MATTYVRKVSQLPETLVANAVYLLQTESGLEIHTVNSTGTATTRSTNKADIDAAIAALEAKQDSLANQPGLEPFFFGS